MNFVIVRMLNYSFAILCLLLIQSFTIHATDENQNSFKSPSCADIYVDVKKCSIDPWCSPFEIDDVQNNADCQKECQNTNRECRSWIQYYKDDENYCQINNCPIPGSSGWLSTCRSITIPVNVSFNECLEHLNECDLFKNANCEFGPELGNSAGDYDLKDCQIICANTPGCTFVQSLPQYCIFYSSILATNCNVAFGPKDPDPEECFNPLTTTTTTTTQTTRTSTTTQTTRTSTIRTSTITQISTTIHDRTCMEPGQCVGNMISRSYGSSYNNCLKQCKKRDICHWFTFDPSILDECMLFENCPELSNDICPECVTGQKECDITII